MTPRASISAFAAVLLIPSLGLAADPATLDWSKVPVKTVKLFYPGQSGYDWLLSPEHKKGDNAVKQGKACALSCHEDDEAAMGNKLVKGGPLEPTPIAGKNGVLDLAVQAAHDAEYLYFRFQWKTNMAREGRMHNYIRFDGKSWDKTKSKDDIAKIKAEGGFLDLMQWRAHRSNIAGMADDGYVLDYRLADEGKGPFTWNVDRKTMTPKFMFDAKKVGAKALREEDIGNLAKPAALLREENTVAYDANAGWKDGDILPGRLVSRADAKGSAADNDATKGTWKDGTYTLVWRRKLNTGRPADDKIMKVGGTYTISFAVHDDNVTTRFHHVSFSFSLGIGVKGDIQAAKLN